jgi:uncharacterized protein (DUF1778 family)
LTPAQETKKGKGMADKKDKPTDSLSVKLTKEQREAFDLAAKKAGMTRSEYMRQTLTQYMDHLITEKK